MGKQCPTCAAEDCYDCGFADPEELREEHKALRAEVERMTRERDAALARRCQCGDDEACAYLRRAESAERRLSLARGVVEALVALHSNARLSNRDTDECWVELDAMVRSALSAWKEGEKGEEP